MALPTIVVKNASGGDETISSIVSGRQAAGDSQGVVLSDEDLAAIDAITTALETPATELPPPVPVGAGNTTLTRATVSISTATTTSIVGATASQTTRVHRIALTIAAGAAQTVTFQSASTSLGAFDIPDTGGSIVFDFSPYWWFKTATNEAFQITTSSTAAVKGIIDYVKGA